MTQIDYTHLTLVVDRSGSMSDIAADMNTGIRALIEEQFAEPGRFTLTLVQFDSRIDTVTRLAAGRCEYELVPRGNTALLDAVGGEIQRTGEDLAAMAESDRPARVLFVVVTDGEENSSQEYSRQQVRELISHQSQNYRWQFQFLGAEEAAWQGGDLGMKQARFARNAASTQGSWNRVNQSMKKFRAESPAVADFQIDEDIDD